MRMPVLQGEEGRVCVTPDSRVLAMFLVLIPFGFPALFPEAREKRRGDI